MEAAAASRSTDAGDREMSACNEALVVGDLVAPPERRELPTGTVLATFSLTVRREGHPTTSVPLVWYDPPKRVWGWKPGARMIATGSVVRRFYRAGGATGSRTEVSVDSAEAMSASARSAKLAGRFAARLRSITDALQP